LTGAATAPVLQIRNLAVCYGSPKGLVRAVRDASLEVGAGEAVALVGETGSGKSTTGLAAAGLLDPQAVESGEVLFQGRDLLRAPERELRRVRGRDVGVVFQQSRSALNPVMTTGAHLVEALRAHASIDRSEARRRVLALLGEVGLPDAVAHRYPFELSGGMCQRVQIALAICHRPKLLIADEPSSALDPTIAAQILDLLRNLRARYSLALLLITHDLQLARSADRVAVMYHGRVVEAGPAAEVCSRPAHPYTRALFEAQVTLGHRREERPLRAVAGVPPEPSIALPGCAFAPRCPLSEPACTAAVPALAALGRSRWAACIKPVWDDASTH